MSRKPKAAWNLDYIADEIMADDPATVDDYGEYEFSGTLEDRVCEIIYNHAYEAVGPYSSITPAAMWTAVAPLRALAEREGFLDEVEEAWVSGLEDGACASNPTSDGRTDEVVTPDHLTPMLERERLSVKEIMQQLQHEYCIVVSESYLRRILRDWGYKRHPGRPARWSYADIEHG